jgi:hypothetical protein
MKKQEQQRYHRQQNQKKNPSVIPVHGTLNLDDHTRSKSCAAG